MDRMVPRFLLDIMYVRISTSEILKANGSPSITVEEMKLYMLTDYAYGRLRLQSFLVYIPYYLVEYSMTFSSIFT